MMLLRMKYLQLVKAKFGDKKKNDPTSFGNNIFISNSNSPSDNEIEKICSGLEIEINNQANNKL